MLYQRENVHGGDLYGRAVKLDFSANTNPLGTPEAVRRAVIDSAGRLNQYPDPCCRALVSALADFEQVPEENILCGCGAAELIFSYCAAARPRRALELAPTFSEYSAALEAAARERDEALEQQQALAERLAQSDARRVQEGQDREALLQEAEALAGEYDALAMERDALALDLDSLTQERDALLAQLSQAQEALDDTTARSQEASARADGLEEQLEMLMEESAQAALVYEQRAQEDAQTIEALAAQAESLFQATDGNDAPLPTPCLTPLLPSTPSPLYTIPAP